VHRVRVTAIVLALLAGCFGGRTDERGLPEEDGERPAEVATTPATAERPPPTIPVREQPPAETAPAPAPITPAEEEALVRSLLAAGDPGSCVGPDEPAGSSPVATVRVTARAEDNGAVSSATVTAPALSDEARRCIEARVRAHRLPAPIRAAPLTLHAAWSVRRAERAPPPATVAGPTTTTGPAYGGPTAGPPSSGVWISGPPGVAPAGTEPTAPVGTEPSVPPGAGSTPIAGPGGTPISGAPSTPIGGGRSP
jgi:hypothetical protein